jgi:hypothetical protein
LPLPILLATFFFVYQKLPQYASMYWYTQNKQDVIAAFFAAGALLGAQSLNFLVVAFSNFYRFIQIFLVLGFISTTMGMNYRNSELWIMCLCAALYGLILSCLISQELYKIDRVKQNGTIPLSFTLFGLFGGLLTWFGDKTHFMNRDDPTWSNISFAVSAGLVIIAFIFSLSWISNGCRCCQCCCQCCNDCCGSYDEDDEDTDQD